MKKENILILAAHPDDGEFGCGASIHRLSKKYEIHYAAFSPCIKSLPKGSKDTIMFEELKKAAKHLNVKIKNIKFFNYPVRDFFKYRQDILEDMIKLRQQIKPKQIFLPNSNDRHQDHQVIHNEGVRAFKNNNILGYELPWNNIKSINNYFIEISEKNLTAKWKAINEYKSQNFRKYKSFDLFKGLALVRGVQINKKYAESFELIKWNI